jgi:hypothetical protein
MFRAFDAILGVDIGGTNIRAGVIQLNLKTAADLSKTKIWKFSLWRHGDEEDIKREHAVDSLADMLKGLIAAAQKKGIKLAPSSVSDALGSSRRTDRSIVAPKTCQGIGRAASSICQRPCIHSSRRSGMKKRR